jgi:hypothetical protein
MQDATSRGQIPGGNFVGSHGQSSSELVIDRFITKPEETYMKISIKPLVLSFALLGLATYANAQGTTTTNSGMTMTPVSGSAYGLLGQNYAGVTFGYTDLDKGPPNDLVSYGFIANRPSEVPNLDASFKYEYSRASAFGINAREHDLAVGATGFLPLADFKPFLEGNVGWAFLKAGSVKSDSFTYLIGAGAEFQVVPRLAVTPYVNFQEAPHLHARMWSYGVKATYRLAQEWSTTVALELNDDHDVGYKIGVNRHF